MIDWYGRKNLVVRVIYSKGVNIFSTENKINQTEPVCNLY